MSKSISRRRFIGRIAAGGGAIALLHTVGCGGDDALTCDASGVDSAGQQTRSALQYTDRSQDPNKKCINCVLYQGTATACGTCVPVPGPIHPEGTCSAFAPRS